MATSISVALAERSYEIEISRGNLAAVGDLLVRRKCTHAIVITDSNVGPLFSASAVESLSAAGVRSDLLTVPAGELSKCVQQADQLWNELARLGADRKSVIVALGGGVVGDLAGFIAATYGRGLALIQVPTSLLAQVDSSVGGKVGINLPAAKNIVGSFWQPAGVLIDLDVLRSLPEREYRSGLGEVVKYGVILDASFFAFLEENAAAVMARDAVVLEHIVARCCQLKASVVEQDEREETGLRVVLNYGHTFCHAIETVTDYRRFLHGEAVSIGMVCASRLAEIVLSLDEEVSKRQRKLLSQFELPISARGLSVNGLLIAMQRDKKAEHGKLRFVLPTQIGKVSLFSDIEPAAVIESLRQLDQ